MIKYSFQPIVHSSSKILILGTMPGELSLSQNEYYAHSRNNFWKIIFSLFNKNYSEDYLSKKKILLDNNIALWDVLQSCERIGSLDSAIKKEIPNDIETFLKIYSNITHIYFNGQKAASFFKKHISVSNNYKLITLPSTSPANASKSFENKLYEWKKITEILI